MHRFQPSTDLPADLLHRRLRLKDLRLVHEFQLQAETEFQHASLLVSACFNQIPCLQWLWRVLCHDKFGQEAQDTILNAFTQREAPALVQAVADLHNLLEEVIRLIDDR